MARFIKLLIGYRNDLRFFEQPRLPFYLALIALILTLPVLSQGLQFDDCHHRVLFLDDIDGVAPKDFPLYKKKDFSIFGMFSLSDGNPSRNIELLDYGLPWWTYKNLRISFLRPISELSLWIDYTLWPDVPVLMHLQNIFLYAIIVAALVILFRRIMGNCMLAGLAAFLYAISRTHNDSLNMVASRNALLATFFGIVVLIVFDRVQKDEWRKGLLIGPLFLAFALLSAEYAVVTTAYLFSYSLFLDPRSIRRKVISLLPYALVSIIWLTIYKAAGFGSGGSGFYIDPIGNPLQFLKSLIDRLPALLSAQWSALPPIGYGPLASSSHKTTIWIFSLVLLVIIGITISPFLKKDASARFWALGVVLALIPMCATIPDERLLIFAGIGVYGLLAQILSPIFIHEIDWSPNTLFAKEFVKAVAMILAFMHVFISPLLLFITPFYTRTFFDHMVVKPATSISADYQYSKQSVIMINPPSVLFTSYMSAVRIIYGLPIPAHTWVLASGSGSMLLSRLDKFTIEIDLEGGFMAADFDRIYRDSSHPLKKGEQVELSGMMATVLTLTEDQRPQKVAFRFEKPLEDESLKFLAWNKNTTYNVRLPDIGESISLLKQDLISK